MANDYKSLDVGGFLRALRAERVEIENAISFLESCDPVSVHTRQADVRSVSDLRSLERAVKHESVKTSKTNDRLTEITRER